MLVCVLNRLALRSSHNRLNPTMVGGGSHRLARNVCMCAFVLYMCVSSCACVCI